MLPVGHAYLSIRLVFVLCKIVRLSVVYGPGKSVVTMLAVLIHFFIFGTKVMNNSLTYSFLINSNIQLGHILIFSTSFVVPLGPWL